MHFEIVLKNMVVKLMKYFNIGDSYSDIIASHRAHVDCMLVNWGLKKIDLECKPTYIVESYDEIRKMLCK